MLSFDSGVEVAITVMEIERISPYTAVKSLISLLYRLCKSELKVAGKNK